MSGKVKQEYVDELVSPLEITPLKTDIHKQLNGSLANQGKRPIIIEHPASDTEASESSPDGAEEREGWGSKIQFLLSVVAYAVGLGNVWRFPYLCQQHGGGAFLIPYFIMLVIEGIPLCVLELGIGQRLRLGSIGVWNKIHPLLGGLGVSCAIVALLVGWYYNAVIAWCFFYLFSSLQTQLPWADCPLQNASVSNVTLTPECAASSPTAYFWFRETLDITPGIDNFGGVQWNVAGCLAFSWMLIFLCMARGIENSGKIMYFTAGFPYLVLIIFFARAITLKGAADGLRHLFTPEMEKLLDPLVWLDAATQIFYSLGLGFGSLIAFGSYNPTGNKFTHDAVFVSLTNAFTAIFASVLVFAILGFKATLGLEGCACREVINLSPLLNLTASELGLVTESPQTCVDYLNVLSADPSTYGLDAGIFVNSSCSFSKLMKEKAEGTGLAFIVFTQAIVELPWAPFWSILFFTMLLALGMGSMFGNLAGIQTSLFDLKLFPSIKKQVQSAIICAVSFIVGLLFVTKSGMYWVGMFDSFVGTFALMIIALLEMIGVCWIYKYSRFAADVKEMTGQTLSRYWEVTLKFLAPIVILGVLLASIVQRAKKGITYSAYDMETAMMNDTAYPPWAQVVAVFLMLVGILPIVIVAVLRLFRVMKYEPDPSLVNAGFNSSASTTMFAKENSLADMESMGRPEQLGNYLRVYRPQFSMTND